MDYRLQVFCEVATQQSISAAAKALCISQPAVTQHIKLLEETFRTPFFIRSRHGVTLTEAGITLLSHARHVATLEEEVVAQLCQPGQTFQGRLRVGTSNTVMQYYLPRVLALFKKQHPSITIEIVGGNSTSTIGALLDQRIDIGLIESPCRRRDLRMRPFFEDEIVVIASPKNPLSKKNLFPFTNFLNLLLFFENKDRERGNMSKNIFSELRSPQNISTLFKNFQAAKRSNEPLRWKWAWALPHASASRMKSPTEHSKSSIFHD